MEQRPRFQKKSLLFIATVIAISIWLSWQRRDDETKDRAEIKSTAQEQTTLQALTPLKRETDVPHALPQTPPSRTDKPAGGRTQRDEADDIAQMIASVSLWDGANLRNALSLLEQKDRETLDRAIIDVFEAAGTQKPALREKALWFATKLNGPTLYPLWDRVLTRASPISADEEDIIALGMQDGHLEAFKWVTSEQLGAIEAMGSLQSRLAEAQTTLEDLAFARISVPGDTTLLRFEAVRVLKAQNPDVMLKLAKLLLPSDPLRMQLATYSTAKREGP